MSGTEQDDLAEARARRFEQVCDRFEEAGRSGPVRIEEYLDGVTEDERPALLLELIRLEVYYRRRVGEAVGTAEYHSRFPEIDVTGLGEVLGREDPSAEPSPWPRVPGYEIQRELGRGGMGVVYEARQLSLNRTVALKMLLCGDHAGRRELVRFRAEGEAVARLRHPNIVHVHEVGYANTLPYLAMEFVDGGSLEDRLDGTPLPAREAAGFAEILARAVQHAHERGVVHRDLKPANVLLSLSREPPASAPRALAGGSRLNEDAPKITDFGLARALGEGTRLTQTGAVMGTPSYMAPEQARGDSKSVGPPADVYALGAVLYEMLTGRPPFKAETPLETLLQVQTADPVPPSRLQAKVPRDLETVCLKCLQKEPRRRYPTAEALADDLNRFLEGRPIQARPVRLGERAVKWARRRPAVASLIAALTLAIVAGLTASWYYAIRAGVEKGQADRRAEEATWSAAGEARARRAAEEDRRRAVMSRFALQMDLAERELGAENPVRAQALLDGVDHGLHGEWEYRHVQAQLTARLRTLRGHDEAVLCLAGSPDGKLLASGSQDHTIRLWDWQSGRELRALENTGHAVWSVAFSPDGRRLASAGEDGVVRLWDVGDDAGRPAGRQVGLLKGHKAAAWGVAFSPDGRRLASAGSDGVVLLWELTASDAPPLALLTLKAPFTSVAFSPDGRLLAAGNNDGKVRLWEAGAGKPPSVRLLRGHTSVVSCVAFSPDGRLLASGSADRTVRLWEPVAGGETAVLSEIPNNVHHVAFSPDGSRVAAGGSDFNTGRGGIPRGGAVGQPLPLQLRGAPVGQRLPLKIGALSRAELKLWDVRTRELLRSQSVHPSLIRGLVFDPEGREVASAGSDGTVRLWTVSPPADLRRLPRSPLGHRGTWCDGDAGRVALQGKDGVVQVLDLASGRELVRLPGMFPRLPKLAFGRGGGVLGLKSSRGVEVWVIPSDRRPVTTPRAVLPVPKPEGIAVHPAGRLVATLSTDPSPVLQLWDVPESEAGPVVTPRHTLTVEAEVARECVFSPDGKWLVTRIAGRLQRRDAETGLLVGEISCSAGPVQGFRISPDSALVAGYSVDRAVRVWDFQTGNEVCCLQGHSQRLWDVAFSPDGRKLASAGGIGLLGDGLTPGEVKIWDVETFQETLTLAEPSGAVQEVSFSPDGNLLALTCSDGTVKLLEAPAQGNR